MKKRRPCSRNPTRSPVNSPNAAGHAANSIPLRSKSSQDLKKRRLQRGNANKQQRRVRDDYTNFKISDAVKKNAFDSLESLFDLKIPLNLPEVPALPYIRREQPEDYSSSDSDSFVYSYHSTNQVDGKEATELIDYRRRDVSKLEELELDILKETLQQEWNEREDYSIASRLHGYMADNENLDGVEDGKTSDPLSPLGEENADSEGTPVAEPIEAPEEIPGLDQNADGIQDPNGESEETAVPDANAESEEGTTVPDQDADLEDAPTSDPNADLEETRPDGSKAEETNEEAISPEFGEGESPKVGGHRESRESTMSSIPLTDSEVIREMAEADQRCKIVDLEIKRIKSELEALKRKEDLEDEDANKIKEKQASLMTKMQEFDEITRKIQRLLGLSDPSSATFAKTFDMLPYPHTKLVSEEIDEKKDDVAKTGEKVDDAVDELSQIPEYPEDKLPRAIVCGFTDDKIPKIVIAGSPRKDTRCLKNLTGKLSESLNMQEKLVQENAKLEGGKYILEEALIEKDNTLDTLQRKLCGLQAEMRMVVKENTELSRQLASVNYQRSVAGDPSCCTTCPPEISPRSAHFYPNSHSCEISPRPEDGSCPCKNCAQDQSVDPGPRPASVICVRSVKPEGFPHRKPCAGSPRLSGGGSGERSLLLSGSTLVESPTMSCRGPSVAKVPSGRPGACPAEMDNQLATYGNSTKQLAQQLDSMESEVRNMQMELANVHRERQQLEQQRKLLKCTGPCAPCSCCPPGQPHVSPSSHQATMNPCVAGASAPSTCQLISETPEVPANSSVPMSLGKMGHQQTPPSCSGVCLTAPMGASTCPQQQLRDLREQYARLQEDYKNKLCEVSCLRADSEKMKQETRDAKEEREKSDNRLLDAQERLRIMESEKLRLHGSKELLVEQEQALLVAKQRYREAQDELEELRSLIQDQANQLEDYRNKYLQAQEEVEEHRRQLDLMEMDNARMNENVTMEIGRVKNQFQEKLAELAPLPDILKQTQAKLQEVQQMRLIAERNCEDLSRELLTCKDKQSAMQNELNALRSENSALQDENGMGSGRCDELEKKNSELRNENDRMKNAIARFEELESQLQTRVDEKMHEVVQLTAMLEQVREDSARQVARTKERCETVRRTMQGQIAEMEKQLAQCRAIARAAQKDRDEIRQKMQGQINNLNEAFEQAQGRIRSLQGHVNYLKTSYSNIFSPGGQAEGTAGFMTSETVGQGYDSCDCNY